MLQRKPNYTHVYNSHKKHVAWLESTPSPRVSIDELKFEDRGSDVSFSVVIQFSKDDVRFFVVGSGRHCAPCLYQHSAITAYILRVECKPSLGDNYPAVLRQMTTHGSNVLLVGRGGYSGVGATFEQVNKIFSASDIKVVLLSDVIESGGK